MRARVLGFSLVVVLAVSGIAAPRSVSLLLPDQSVKCETDGVEGKRIAAIYLYPAGTTNNLASYTTEIRKALSKIDRVWDAAADPFDQHPRWACFASTSLPRIVSFRGPRVGTDGRYTFSEVQNALAAAGFASSRRVYVVFADGIDDAYDFSGQATVDDDDRPTGDNLNNTGPAYAMIDAQSRGWVGSAMWYSALSELGHALGAVQCSAPHASCDPGEAGHHHCYDEYDVMCYEDGGSYYAGSDGTLRTSDDRSVSVVCSSSSTAARQWDCGKNDYFNIAPAAGSYLATHWNLKNSGFVTPRRQE